PPLKKGPNGPFFNGGRDDVNGAKGSTIFSSDKRVARRRDEKIVPLRAAQPRGKEIPPHPPPY
ncbi:MAG: hypothetical protein PHS57_03165, partial [Alphaproteobacteria bacterium]|nr:hypothetical protein [Alphaproteobacteria bacterium]